MTLLVDRKEIPRPVGRDEWLRARRPYFGASAAAVLFDRHPYLSPGDFATSKLTGKEQQRTQAMERGIRLEAVIADWWAEMNDCQVYEPPVMFTAGRVCATVDRLVGSTGAQSSGPAVGEAVEIKSINQYAPSPVPYWIDQCQAIMLCTGTERCWLVWFDSTMEIKSVSLAADEERMGQIVDGAERFMAAIDLGMIPDWVSLDYANQMALHPQPTLGVVELDDAGMGWVSALATARAARLAAERDEERIKAAVAGILGDHEVGTFHGAPVVTWKSIRGSMVLDVERLKAEHPELLVDYWTTKPGSRRMMVATDTEDAA